MAQRLIEIDRYEGMISPAEADLLFVLASRRRPGCIVEIGSWRGKSSIAMALGVQTLPPDIRPTIYCVEPHASFTGVLGGEFGPQDRTAFYKAMLESGCTETVALINLPSGEAAKAWSKPIGLLFIDGDHSDAGVRDDVSAWCPFVMDGGLVVFDDATNKNIGPSKAVSQLLSSGVFEQIENVGKIVVLRKIADAASSKARRNQRDATVQLTALAEQNGYDGAFALKRLQLGSFVSPKHRYMFQETPKAACTSIKRMLVEIEGCKFEENAKPYQRETTRNMLVHQRRYVHMRTLLDMPAAARDNILSGKDNWFTFAVVRNPYSRIVSTFENKVRLGEPRYRALEARYGGRSKFPDAVAAFRRFVADVVRESVQRADDVHFRPQSELLLLGLIPYTMIFKLEFVAEMVTALQRVVALKSPDKQVVLERDNSSNRVPWRNYYDQATAAVVRQAYATDFASFGYDDADWKTDDKVVPETETERQLRAQIVERNAFIDHLYQWILEKKKPG